MSTALPSSVNYSEQHSTLPADAQRIEIVASPINGSTFQAGGALIQFDLINRANSFLIPDSMYLRYSYAVTSAVSAEWVGTPAYTPLNRSEVIISSQTIETISNYNQIMNLVVNTQLDIGQKYGVQGLYGFYASTGVPSNEQMDGRLCTLNETGAFAVPLMNCLSMAEKYIPLSIIPSARIQLTTAPISEIFSQTVVPTAFVMSNVELVYSVLDLPSADAYVRSLDKFYIKSSSWVNSAVTLPAGTSGQNSLVFNTRLASIKGLVISNSGQDLTTSKNGIFDSFHPTANATHQFNVGGVYYPSRPLTVANKAGILMSLKQCMGSIFNPSNSMSINNVEHAYVAGDTTTFSAPAKAWIGVPTEKLHTGSLLTGISSQNSPITYIVTTTSATAKALLVNLMINFDMLLEFDVQSRQVSAKQ